jgi:hypothetical protein
MSKIRFEDPMEVNNKITVFWMSDRVVLHMGNTKYSEELAAFIFKVDESLHVLSLSFLYTLHGKYTEIGD